MRITGKVSHFGGPSDTGVSPSEDLAWWEDWDDVVEDKATELFLPHQPPNTTGLARRLNPDKFYHRHALGLRSILERPSRDQRRQGLGACRERAAVSGAACGLGAEREHRAALPTSRRAS